MTRLLIKALFLFPPETAHYLALDMLKFLYKIPLVKQIIFKKHKNSNTYVHLAGLKFINRLGLAAGFDKNAKYMEVIRGLGFGFMEVGTVTPRPQIGNPKPRLFRLTKDRAIINRMGFNNDGLEVICDRLKKYEREDFIIGGNIGKNKDTPNEKAIDDYMKCFEVLFDFVDYFTINVSSPNTPNLRELQTKENLLKILLPIQEFNTSKGKPKPVFLKIAPDIDDSQLEEIIEAATEAKINGIIANNTSISREGLTYSEDYLSTIGNGGLSGQPILEVSNRLIKKIKMQLDDELLLIGAGGIMNEKDAKERIASGADLIQIYTGFIYGGAELVQKLRKI